jgi:hypothetical protein
MKYLLLFMIFSTIIFSQDFEYVGSNGCKMCHKKEEKGSQFSKWEATAHAKAFETLKSEAAAKIAADKGLTVDAWKTPECVICHTTGFDNGGYEINDDSFWNPATDDKIANKAVKRMNGLQAVGCEVCHGAGSKYKSSKIMKSIYAGEAEGKDFGLNQISEETCLVCHNENSPTFKPFNYTERIKKIEHPMP